MLETITTPASSLVSLDDTKTSLGIIGTDYDVVLADLILRASATVTSFIGRPLLAGEYRETCRLQHPTGKILLSAWPVQSITSITVASEALDPSGYECDESGMLLRVNAKGRYECWAPEVTVVTYTAGFDTTPADVQAATMSLIADAWSARGRDPGMRSIGIGSISLSYFDPLARNALASVEHLLQPYRVPAVG